MAEREHDIVLFGATGFTGGLTADYLAEHADQGTKWALAGRSRNKLEAVRRGLGDSHAGIPLVEADVWDPASMRALAESTKVVITTVGPYINYGEPLVAACAAAGTDYVDLTGEPEFVDLMWLRYHEQAEGSGARIVHSCGFDSIPYDLGALYTVLQLPEGRPIELECFVRSRGTFSGGTTTRPSTSWAACVRGACGPRAPHARARPSGRSVRGLSGHPHNEPEVGGWVVPFPTIDPQTVLRSARTLDRYGPEFTYSHYLVVGKLPLVAGMAMGAGTAIALAQAKPTRNLLLRIKDPGRRADARATS